ncbi:substrate-binding periplasmic protein [Pseudomonas putida]
MKRHWLSIGLVVASIINGAQAAEVASPACNPADAPATAKPGVLTVVTAVIPPFSIPSADGIKGVDGDIINQVASAACLKVAVIIADTRAVLQYVSSGQADVAIGNWFRTAARGQVMGLSDPLYLDSLGIYSKQPVTRLQQLVDAGNTVGTVQGYFWVRDLQALFGSKLKLYPNPVALIQDLKAGRIEVALDSYSGGIYAQQQGALDGYRLSRAEPDARVKSTIAPAQISFVYARENQAFGEALNAGIEQLQKRKAVAEVLTTYGLSPLDADVGQPRFIQ